MARCCCTPKPSNERWGGGRCGRPLFHYELYDATGGHAGAWNTLGAHKEVQLSAERAVERGWAIVREYGKGSTKMRSASLTDEGRRMARKGLW